MKKIAWPLAVSLIIIGFVTGMGAGYWLTPNYSVTMYEKNGMDLGRPDRLVDLRYVNAMIAHHRGAMLLAEQAQQSKRPEIAGLAKEILSAEPKAIDELYAWKRAWYKDGRAVRDPIPAHLGDVDDKFDLRFLNALISHHKTGIEMTKEIRTKSSRTEVLDNADGVEAFLSGGVKMLSEWRSAWYKI